MSNVLMRMINFVGENERKYLKNMKNENIAEKLLSDGLELLNSGNDKKLEKGFGLLRASSVLGNMTAIYYEGICYKEGLGIYQSAERAFERFNMAADSIVEAMFELGLCYIHGIGTEQDIHKSFECFSEAAQSGLPEAQYELAVCYRYGEGTEQNIEEALFWYEEAASQGYLKAYHNMGVIYQNGLGGIPKDNNKAFDCFKKAAEEENVESFFCIGQCYLNGLGVDKNEKEAACWFKKAAEFGEPDSMFHLAWMYQEGIGVEQNSKLSVEYLYKSAEAGWEPAIKIIEGED